MHCSYAIRCTCTTLFASQYSSPDHHPRHSPTPVQDLPPAHTEGVCEGEGGAISCVQPISCSHPISLSTPFPVSTPFPCPPHFLFLPHFLVHPISCFYPISCVHPISCFYLISLSSPFLNDKFEVLLIPHATACRPVTRTFRWPLATPPGPLG